jgi:hypothetical protein
MPPRQRAAAAEPAPEAEAEFTYATIYELMGQILAELPAIGKNQRNAEQNFMFRGYDDVLNALNPLMSERGVFIVPDVIERLSAHRQTRGGSTMYEVNLHVRFTCHGPAGDTVSGTAWGEGTDMGDKATNKAMTNALKYFLFQTFAISTQEASETDADRHTPEETQADVLYCRVCQEAIDGARSDREKMSVHLIEEHGWVRVAEGVVPPEKAAELEKGAQDKAAEAPQDGSGANADDPDSSTVGTTPVDGGTDLSWVDDLKGKDLVATGQSYGVSVAGKVDELRQRIKDAVVAGVTPRAATPDGPAEDPSDPAADEPAADDTADDAGAGAGDETAADDGAVEGGEFECPGDGCGKSFNTEEEYTAHWYAAHDDDGEAADDPEAGVQPEQDGTSNTLEALVATVKERIGALSGEHARAYGKYRREASLPKPDEMDAEQAQGLLDFLDGIGA